MTGILAGNLISAMSSPFIVILTRVSFKQALRSSCELLRPTIRQLHVNSCNSKEAFGKII